MKRLVAGMAATAALVGGLVVYDSVRDKPGKVPPSVFDRMQFPPDEVMEEMDGDEHGTMCQQLDLRTADGTTMVAWHKLWRHDFRNMTVGQKKAALIQGAKDAAREANLMACSDPAGKVWLHQAHAQPHCDQCGGGCDTRSCPGHTVVGGGCAHGGTTCTITILCCSGSCAC